MIVLVVIAALLVGLLLLGGWGFTLHRTDEASCADCRYPIEGLRADICPECGADLTGAGTRRPGARVLVHPPVPLAAVCRTTLVLIAFLPAFLYARSEYPRAVSTATATAISRAGLFESLLVVGRGHVDLAPHTSHHTHNVLRDTTFAELRGRHGVYSLRVIDRSFRIEWNSANGRRVRSTDGIQDSDVLDWLKSAGVDMTHPQAKAEARSVATLIRNIAAGGEAIYVTEPGGDLKGLVAVTMKANRWTTIQPVALALLLLPVIGAWCFLMWDLRRWHRKRSRYIESRLKTSAKSDFMCSQLR